MIYLASPYTHKSEKVMEARFKITEFVTAFYLKQFQPVFSPIVHCHEIARLYKLPTDFKYWQQMNRAWIKKSDMMRLLQFPEWKRSIGVDGEVKIAKEYDLLVELIAWKEILDTVRIFPKSEKLRDCADLLEKASRDSFD